VAYAISGESTRWPEGMVPYEISADFSASQVRTVKRAIAHWNRRTIMRLRTRSGEDDFVIFAPADDSCSSPIGRQGGGQTIGCAVGDGFTAGSVIHEIGHSVGYFHEQQRPDRDAFLDVREENIEAGKEHNFDIRMGGIVLGPYDYGSIMHYPRDAFSENGDTRVPLQDVPIGQRDGLSTRDVHGLNVLYEAPHVVVAWEDDVRETGSPSVRWAGLSRWGKYAWGPVAAGDGRVPNVEMDGDHSCVVVWHEGDDSTDVRARCLTVDGADRFEELTASAGPGSHGHPDVAMTPGGELVVVWQTTLGAGAQEIRARGFSRSGDERFGQVLVSEGSAGVPAGPAVDMDLLGNFVVAWGELLDTDELVVRARGFDHGGAERFATITVASGLGDQDVFPRVGVAGDGSFAVVWEARLREVRMRRYDAAGAETHPEIAVNAAPPGAQLLADVASTPGWGFDVVWNDDRNENRVGQVRARAFFADGPERLAEFTVNPRGGGEQLRPRVAVDGRSRRYVVWEDDEDRNGKFQVHARGVDADEQAFLRRITVNRVWRGQQRRPAVAAR
jgi:hypothetical protein